LILKGEKSKLIHEKVNNLLQDANFLNEKNKFPTELTFGQNQIVAIMRAIVTNPKIILLDEPMNHIDTNKEKMVWNLINKYKDPNAVIVFTTSQKYILENFEGHVIDMHSYHI
jgi:ABC-type lipoprotein export system ATPase subunit